MRDINKFFRNKYRLESLLEYDILDTAPEKEFDELAKLAAIICDVPIALITFMDDKNQYFKSRYGTDLSENQIENSFCKHLVDNHIELLEIPDLSADSRTAKNPFVINSPHLLFYAAYPLNNVEGHLLGSICVHDFQEKNLSKNQKDALKIIGQQIIKLLETRKNKIQLEKENKKLISHTKNLQNAIEIRDLGTWEWNIETNETKFNNKWAEILGYKLSEFKTTSFQTWVDLMHPDDLSNASDKVHKAFIKDGEILNNEFRMRKKDGTYVWIESKGKIIKRDTNGKPLIIAGTHLDITNQKITELHLTKIHENIPAAVFRYIAKNDGTNQLLYYNKKLNMLYDIPEDLNLEGENINLVWNKIHPEDIPIIQNAIEKSKKELIDYKAEYRILGKNNSIKWLKAQGSLCFTNDTETVWDTVVFDITQEKLAKNRLNEINKQLKKAQKIAKLGYWKHNLDNDSLTWSNEIYNILELDKNNTTASSDLFFEMVHPDDKQQFLEKSNKAKAENCIANIEHRILLPDGRIKWIEITTGTQYVNLKNERVRECVVQDITNKKQQSFLVKESNDRFKLATKATSDIIWDWDMVKNRVLFGENFKELINGDFDDEKIKSEDFMNTYINPNDRKRVNKSLMNVIRGNRSQWDVKYRLKLKDGQYINVENKALIIRDNQGKPLRMVGAMNNITEQINQNKKLSQLNNVLTTKSEELVLSNNDLEQFAYVASHDLQEPLRMITSFLTLLEKKYDNKLDDKAKTYIHFAVDGAKRMRKIILDLLDYSRVGRLETQATDIDIAELINDIINFNHRKIGKLNASIKLKEFPTIKSHSSELSQVFSNLISNALKYQKPNKKPIITISCKDIKTHWEFSIEDNGIGIDEKYFNQIFIIFKRLHRKEEYSGTGIGLAVTKKIVNSLGGKIWIEKAKRQGSIFKFTIKKV